jgi:hypothetical protein
MPSHIKDPLVKTTWRIDEVQFHTALLNYIEVDPFATSMLSCDMDNEGYVITLTEDSDSHARRIAAELRKEEEENKPRPMEWNDVRAEVIGLLKLARSPNTGFDLPKWRQDAARIIQLFG